MSEIQSIIAIIMALIIGFVIGRRTRQTQQPSQTELTREEQMLLSGKQQAHLDPFDEFHSDVREALKDGRTLEAIKLYRQHHGTDLKSAKEAIDFLIKNLKS